MSLYSKLRMLLLCSVLLLISACSDSSTNSDDIINYSITLEPVEAGLGTGSATLKFNKTTRKLDGTISWDLVNDTLTTLHFHGPAEAGQQAGIIHHIPYGDEHLIPKGSLTITGDALTQDEANQLTSGKWYINIHSSKKPDGIIRGWVK